MQQDMAVEENLETKMLEAQVESLMTKIKAMEQQMEQLRGDNDKLKQRINEKESSKYQKGWEGHGGWEGQETWGGSEKEWDNDDYKGDNQKGKQWERDGWKDGWSMERRTYRGEWGWTTERLNDRRDEMVLKGFPRNTHWKEIKAKGEALMNESGVEYKFVRVIGAMSSFCIVVFKDNQEKRRFKGWLIDNGRRVYSEERLWFGDNVDKDARERERAVGKTKKTLMKEREGRKDVERDFRRGRVWVGRELIAEWDVMSRKMKFRGTGKGIQAEYERMMWEEKGEREEFSN